MEAIEFDVESDTESIASSFSERGPKRLFTVEVEDILAHINLTDKLDKLTDEFLESDLIHGMGRIDGVTDVPVDWKKKRTKKLNSI